MCPAMCKLLWTQKEQEWEPPCLHGGYILVRTGSQRAVKHINKYSTFSSDNRYKEMNWCGVLESKKSKVMGLY